MTCENDNMWKGIVMKLNPDQTTAWFLQHLEKLGITQQEFAQRAGITPADVSKYKQQKQRPRVEHLDRLALALEIDVVTLLIGLGAIDAKAVTTPKIEKARKVVRWSKD